MLEQWPRMSRRRGGREAGRAFWAQGQQARPAGLKGMRWYFLNAFLCRSALSYTLYYVILAGGPKVDIAVSII